jgi:lambda family phage minor tail protein L
MSYSVNATFSSEQVKLEQTRLVEMYVVNASLTGVDYLYFVNNNQDVYGYSLNASGDLTATEQIYTGLPIQREAIANNIQGQIPTFSVSIPNTDRVMESIIQEQNYLRGRDLHLVVGFAKHLPTGSTAYHVGENPDHYSFIKEKVYIDSTSSDETAVSFACRPKFDIKAAVIPRRKYINKCSWAMIDDYLGEYCDPLGSINSASYLTCDGTLDSCKERGNEKRFGGFTSIPSKGIVIL